ncbi:biotin--[acetyl-CoA-carboxylase] ligase [Larsenimonas salina]|uniref:biotin--[acetyl-CoA-carboxylase] ligase n=1 Tax=Larsenimonas salina TaxID=1295565 RepID=UPI002072ED1D|nr:biotin--[acetyl-CoA-carboxylase] ligase [Larsenimonas salina]MCM5705447.1 biotin--[acetyl-CoA-carboxylase] ligase [Larsenimonas salina]
MTVRDLLRLLCDGEYHSGEELGEYFGVSRTAIWKQLKKLEQMGIPIEATRGRGYRVPKGRGPLNGNEIIAGLGREARRGLTRLFVEDSLPSTNAFMLDRFVHGAGHGEVALAEVQTAGRGRRGRAWVSSWGQGVYLSMGWRFSKGVAALEGLSLAVGVVVADLLSGHGVPVKLKWPNDVLVEKSGAFFKLGGNLLEVRGDMEGPCDVVVGIGLNMDAPDPARLAAIQPVAGVRDYAELDRNGVVSELLEQLLKLMPEFEAAGFEAFADRWNTYHAFKGREIMVAQGNDAFQALAQGVDESGRLQVERDGVIEWLSGGEVTVRESA